MFASLFCFKYHYHSFVLNFKQNKTLISKINGGHNPFLNSNHFKNIALSLFYKLIYQKIILKHHPNSKLHFNIIY